MDFVIGDHRSRRAAAITGLSLFSYDGNQSGGVRRVLSLDAEPNQVQTGYDETQVVVAIWKAGLKCYDLSSGRVRWTLPVPERVGRIVFDESQPAYFVESEDAYGSVEIDRSGAIIKKYDCRVLHSFSNGRYLFAVGRDEIWSVRERDSGRVVCVGNDIRGPMNTVYGNESIVAFSPSRGVVEVYDLSSGKQVYRLERGSWFSVKGLSGLVKSDTLRLLVSDWNGKPGGAVLEIDVSRCGKSVIAESPLWTYNTVLVNGGMSVLRFFPRAEERFLEFDL